MATKKTPSAKKDVATAATTYRGKVAMAGFADGSKTVKQAAKAAEKLAATLKALDAGGAKLESPVGRNVAVVITTDGKLAKKFDMAPVKAGKSAAPAKKSADVATKVTRKKAAGRKRASGPAAQVSQPDTATSAG